MGAKLSTVFGDDPVATARALKHGIPFTGTSRSPLGNVLFNFRLTTSPPSDDPSFKYARCILVDSTGDFIPKQVTIDSGPYQGRTALIFDPRPAGRKAFAFMDLPTEIRHMVYKKLLVTKSDIQYQEYSYDNKPRVTGLDTIEPNIVMVSKHIREEALAVILGENKFIFPQPSDAIHFLKTVPPAVAMLKNITITRALTHHKARPLFRMLAEANNLRYINIGRLELRGADFALLCSSNLRCRNLKAITPKDTIEKEVTHLIGLFRLIHGPCLNPVRCDCAQYFAQRMSDVRQEMLIKWKYYN
ncbi:hypothetical protein BDZ85DRAFT_285970 [Elsinoe ampelina]|uniref:Uncharacterized protein n=1 Tax=Elsinoe ampelina TaxID=302913 RepID=A0A6A6FZL5_9PEZI|nr:hypothetical protein BDZ85DRAFT_285970 [Elsinoe ampelina]